MPVAVAVAVQVCGELCLLLDLRLHLPDCDPCVLLPSMYLCPYTLPTQRSVPAPICTPNASLCSCSGNPKMEPGAVVCRIAPSFVRFGTFQLPASRGGEELKLVGQVADYVIEHHFPDLQGDTSSA